MSAMANYFEAAMLNTMRNMPATAPAAVYIALFLSDPTESGMAGTEVSYTNYARKALTFSAPTTSGTTVRMANAEEIIFAMPSGSAGTVTHAGIMTALTGGNMLVYKELTNPIILTAEISPRFAAGEIALTMFGGNLDPAFKARVLNYLRGTTIAGFVPFLALYNGDPTVDASELGGTGYKRLPLVFDAPEEQDSGQMLMRNTNTAQSGPATVNWGSWAYGVIMDAETGGNRVWYKQNIGTYAMNNNAQAYLRAGDVSIALN